jgi:hypothetical protein
MLDKQHGDYVFRCDQAGCDRELLTGTSNLEGRFARGCSK